VCPLKNLRPSPVRRNGEDGDLVSYRQVFERLARNGSSVPREVLSFLGKVYLRGYLNAILAETNPDRVWPYWLERQLDFHSPCYLPRGLPALAVNLTGVNWTAIGAPDFEHEAVIDPRGLLTPVPAGWSLDAFLHDENGVLIPARLRADAVSQEALDNTPVITTRYRWFGLTLERTAFAVCFDGCPVAVEQVAIHNGLAARACRFYYAVRPYNPEGFSPIWEITCSNRQVLVNGRVGVCFGVAPNLFAAADENEDDPVVSFSQLTSRRRATSRIGLATGLAAYHLSLAPNTVATFTFFVPLAPVFPARTRAVAASFGANLLDQVRTYWATRKKEGLQLDVPDRRVQDCFEANKAYLLVLTGGESITPGPLTYHRFWFRDAAYMVEALMKVGYLAEAARIIAAYPRRQRRDGYFLGRNWEWDANGQAIRPMLEHFRLTGEQERLAALYPSIVRGITWIARTLEPDGLLPPGLSAEHLGPPARYYWDNFWALAGVGEGIRAARVLGRVKDAKRFADLYAALETAIRRHLEADAARLGRALMPAGPGQPFNPGAVGSLCSVYPLGLMDPCDLRVRSTVEELMTRWGEAGAYLHNITHGGINVYLSCHLAQCLLLAGEGDRAHAILRSLLELASPTFTWPEAVNPRTGGGCMGDGHHGWAAADWLLLLRNGLLYEAGDRVVVGAGVPLAWYTSGNGFEVRGAPTHFGRLDFAVEGRGTLVKLNLEPGWREAPACIEWRLPHPIAVLDGGGAVIAGGPRRVILSAAATRVTVKMVDPELPTHGH